MEAFHLNAGAIRGKHGAKYDDAIKQARDYYQQNIIPQLQQQRQQAVTQ